MGRIVNDNSRVVSQYTDKVEEQHAYIKETVDTVFPSNIRILTGVLDKIRLKIQKLEKAIQTQSEVCKEPCVTRCPSLGPTPSTLHIRSTVIRLPRTEDGFSSRAGLMAALTSADAGMNIDAVLETSPLMLARVTAKPLVNTGWVTIASVS